MTRPTATIDGNALNTEGIAPHASAKSTGPAGTYINKDDVARLKETMELQYKKYQHELETYERMKKLHQEMREKIHQHGIDTRRALAEGMDIEETTILGVADLPDDTKHTTSSESLPAETKNFDEYTDVIKQLHKIKSAKKYLQESINLYEESLELLHNNESRSHLDDAALDQYSGAGESAEKAFENATKAQLKKVKAMVASLEDRKKAGLKLKKEDKQNLVDALEKAQLTNVDENDPDMKVLTNVVTQVINDPDSEIVIVKEKDQTVIVQRPARRPDPVEIYHIKEGDTLSKIAQARYGDMNLWPAIWNYIWTDPQTFKRSDNRKIIGENPNLIYTREQMQQMNLSGIDFIALPSTQDARDFMVKHKGKPWLKR